MRPLIFLAVCATACGVHAELRLGSPFTDNMVLQRETREPVWGWAAPNEQVTLQGSWGERAGVVADAQGAWLVKMATRAAGGPYSLEVCGASETTTLQNVMLGDVWLCSGQSNMEKPTGKQGGQVPCLDSKKELAAANYPNIRLYKVPKRKSAAPEKTCDAKWQVCTTKTVDRFSACGYFFGRALHKSLGVPIGLMEATWGGTEVEQWTSEKALLRVQELAERIKRNDKAPPHSLLFNGMIAPVTPYALRGAIWYQGEANVMRAFQYRRSFPLLIEDWREQWKQGDFPFLFVQIAPFTGYDARPGNSAELRDAQLFTLRTVKNTGMAVTTDITDNPNDIHPPNKQEVGRRLALWAMDIAYGDKKMECSGPLYSEMRVEGDAIRLMFDHTAGKLDAHGGPLREFTIAGADTNFVPADAAIDGETVVVRAKGVAKPVAVRFGWSNAPQPNLFNKTGLPASPFRTDAWPGATDGKRW